MWTIIIFMDVSGQSGVAAADDQIVNYKYTIANISIQ